MTTRRSFLQCLVAAISGVSLPTVSTGAMTEVVNEAGRFEFTGPQFFDCGNQIGVALRLPDGRRHAVRRKCGYTQDITKQDVSDMKLALLDWAEAQYRKAA